jgi:hypothetical protein
MHFKDANGTLFRDGDYILSTGDGLGAFTMINFEGARTPLASAVGKSQSHQSIATVTKFSGGFL